MHTVEIVGRMVSVDAISVSVLQTQSTSTGPVFSK